MYCRTFRVSKKVQFEFTKTITKGPQKLLILSVLEALVASFVGRQCQWKESLRF